MEICTVTHLECSHCEMVCDKITNKNKVAIDILEISTDLIRAIEYNDKNYINMNVDRLISSAKYFKDVFKCT